MKNLFNSETRIIVYHTHLLRKNGFGIKAAVQGVPEAVESVQHSQQTQYWERRVLDRHSHRQLGSQKGIQWWLGNRNYTFYSETDKQDNIIFAQMNTMNKIDFKMDKQIMFWMDFQILIIRYEWKRGY